MRTGQKIAIIALGCLFFAVIFWEVGPPSIHMDRAAVRFVERNSIELTGLARRSGCDLGLIRGKVAQLIVSESGGSGLALERMAVGVSSGVESGSCYLILPTSLDNFFVFDLVKSCWEFDRRRISTLAQCS